MLKFHLLPVTSVEQIAEDAFGILLEIPAELRDTFVWEAGQHITVRRSVQGREERRPYSIVNAPGPGTGAIRLGVRVQPGGRVSGDLAATLRAGDPPTGQTVSVPCSTCQSTSFRRAGSSTVPLRNGVTMATVNPANRSPFDAIPKLRHPDGWSSK